MSQTILALDLGSYSVKVLRLVRRVQDLQLVDFIEEPLNPHSRLLHDEQIRVALEKIFSNRKLDADVVCTSLPGQLLSTRVLELPFANIKKTGQVIDFELEGAVPFDIEDIFSDYHILKQTPGADSQVLCLYTKTAVFQKYQDSLASLNIQAKYFGADLVDLAGLAQVSLVPAEGYYAICDIGHSKTNVIVMEGKNLRYARTIGLGGFHFTRAIQRTFNLNQEKAEAIKTTRGKVYVKQEDSDQVSRILNKVAKELASALKQTFLGARHYYPNLLVPAIYCCGGGSKLVGLLDFLSFYLRANVFEVDTLNYVSHQIADADEANRILPQALATAVRPIYSTRVPKINFRKGPYAFKQDLQFITSEFRSLGVMLLIVFILGFSYYFYASHYYTNKMEQIDKQVLAMAENSFKDLAGEVGKKGSKNKKNNLSKYLKSAQEELKKLKTQTESYQSGAGGVVQILTDVSSALPPKSDVNLEVREVNYPGDFVNLIAVTNDTLNVEKIVAALQNSGKFAKVESTDAQSKPGNLGEFTLKIELKKE